MGTACSCNAVISVRTEHLFFKFHIMCLFIAIIWLRFCDGLGVGRSHCWKNVRFGTELVTLWEQHLAWDCASHTLETRFGLGLSQSHFGIHTWFGTGPVTLWEEHPVLDWAGHIVGRHRLKVFENEPGEDIRA